MWYFEVLPAHPRPYSLEDTPESFSSLLMRTTHDNKINTVRALFDLTGIKWRFRVSDLDIYPISLEPFVLLFNLAYDDIKRTTFYHLIKKLNHDKTQEYIQIKRPAILRGSLSSSLRYCPKCLVEKMYYRLHWRITDISGCIIHRNKFRDKCSKCGNKIAVFQLKVPPGICPSCGHELKDCPIENMDEEGILECTKRTKDILFLLQPKAWENDENLYRGLSSFLYYSRSINMISRQDAERKLNVSASKRRALEGLRMKNGENLKLYFKYCDMLDINLQTLFIEGLNMRSLTAAELGFLIVQERVKRVLDNLRSDLNHYPTMADLERTVDRRLMNYRKLDPGFYKYVSDELSKLQDLFISKHEAHILEQLPQIAEKIAQGVLPAKIDSFAQETKIWRPTLAKIKSVNLYIRNFLRAYNTKAGYQEERLLFRKLKESLRTIMREGLPLSPSNVCTNAGISHHELNRKPKVGIFINKVVSYCQNLREAWMRAEVVNLIMFMQEEGEEITRKKILERTNVTEGQLREHPDLVNIINQAKIEQKRLFHKLKEALREMMYQRIPLSPWRVCEEARVGQKVLKNPKVHLFVCKMVSYCQKLRETWMRAEVVNLILFMQEEGEEVTRKKILARSTITRTQLEHRPDLLEMIRQARNK